METELWKKRQPNQNAWRKKNSQRRVKEEPRRARATVPPERRNLEVRNDQQARRQTLNGRCALLPDVASEAPNENKISDAYRERALNGG